MRSRITPNEDNQTSGAGDQIRVDDVSGSVVAAGRGAIAVGSGASVTINQALTAADQARAQQDYEGEILGKAVAKRIAELEALSTRSPALGGNPFKSLDPYELSDAGQFFGRDAVIDHLVGEIQGDDLRSRFTVLVGETGVGKTSLLQAGILPTLVSLQHLPLLVRVGSQPLPEAIKTTLIPDLTYTPGLERLPLRHFFSRVTQMLPSGKHVYIVLDQFENFFDASVGTMGAGTTGSGEVSAGAAGFNGARDGDALQIRRNFGTELTDSLYTAPPCGNWLISVRASRQGYLSTVIQRPISHTIILSPLSRPEAHSAILEPATRHGYEFEEGLLELLLDDLGPDAIDPARLQLVCFQLVKELDPGSRRLTRDSYIAKGRVAGIWSNYLEDTLNRFVVPELRSSAWASLAVIAEASSPVHPQRVLGELVQEGLSLDRAKSVLGTMENNSLVRQTESGYQLGSPAFKKPVREWKARRAALIQARLEARRQVEKIRNSALRGLLGGGIGMFIAVLITYWGQINNKLFLAFIAAYDILPGAVAGFVLVLSIDLALASYSGSKRWRIYPAGALAGGFAFTLMLLAHVAFTKVGQDPLAFFWVIVEGMLWGAAAGISASLATGTRRPFWLGLLITTLLCGLALLLGEWIGGAFQIKAPSIQVFVAGAVLPVLIVLLAAAGRRVSWLEQDVA